MSPTVGALQIFPVKGVRALNVRAMEVEPWGPRGDRRWLVVDADNRFVTQREAPALATLVAHVTDKGLALTAPGLEPLEVRTPGAGAERASVMIFRAQVDAAVAAGAAHAWLSRLLGEPCRLVYMDAPAAARPDPAGGTVSFADEHPLLLTTTASLAAFNKAAGLDTPMSRFRPNLVVEGTDAWEEDGWSGIAVGEAEFEVIGGCGRCVVTTIDQQSGARDPGAEPLMSLGRLRRTSQGKIPFGVHLRPVRLGRIRVGDPLVVLQRTADAAD